jgi:hypothetical protein
MTRSQILIVCICRQVTLCGGRGASESTHCNEISCSGGCVRISGWKGPLWITGSSKAVVGVEGFLVFPPRSIRSNMKSDQIISCRRARSASSRPQSESALNISRACATRNPKATCARALSSLPSIQDFISPYQRNRFDRYRDAPPESTWAWRQSAWKYTSSIAKSQYAFAIRFHESFVILAIHLILSDLLLRNGCRDERKLRASIAYRIIGGNKSSSLDSRV